VKGGGRMKKLIILVLLFAIFWSWGCGGGGGQNSTESSNSIIKEMTSVEELANAAGTSKSFSAGDAKFWVINGERQNDFLTLTLEFQSLSEEKYRGISLYIFSEKEIEVVNYQHDYLWQSLRAKNCDAGKQIEKNLANLPNWLIGVAFDADFKNLGKIKIKTIADNHLKLIVKCHSPSK